MHSGKECSVRTHPLLHGTPALLVALNQIGWEATIPPFYLLFQGIAPDFFARPGRPSKIPSV